MAYQSVARLQVAGPILCVMFKLFNLTILFAIAVVTVDEQLIYQIDQNFVLPTEIKLNSTEIIKKNKTH